MNDHDIQRYLQIRDEIFEEIKKIGPAVINLQDATKSLLSQVDVFKALSQRVEEHLKEAITDASHELAHTVAQDFSTKIDSQIQPILTTLDQSVQYARRTLEVSKSAKIRKMFLLCVVGSFISGIIGAGVGYFYTKRHSYTLPPDFLKMYALGHQYKESLSKKGLQEKRKSEQRWSKKL